jgi:polyferredoxin
MCVQVCPVGIDIRNGLQYECIACGLCIDACDNVMDLMGFQRGLIRYSTQNAIDGKASRVLRPRIVAYGLLLLGLIAAFAWGIGHRSPLIAEVLRDRNALYRVGEHGIDNGYTLKLVNKTDQAQEYLITLETDIAGMVLAKGSPATVKADAEQVLSLPLDVSAPEEVSGRHQIRFVIESVDGKTRKTVDSSFFGPL